jgi:hypothetical protein
MLSEGEKKRGINLWHLRALDTNARASNTPLGMDTIISREDTVIIAIDTMITLTFRITQEGKNSLREKSLLRALSSFGWGVLKHMTKKTFSVCRCLDHSISLRVP